MDMTDLYKAIVFPETSPSKIPQGAALRIVTKKDETIFFPILYIIIILTILPVFCHPCLSLSCLRTLANHQLGYLEVEFCYCCFFVSSYKRNVRNASTTWLAFFSEHHCFGAELSKIYACITAWVCGIQKSLPTFFANLGLWTPVFCLS